VAARGATEAVSGRGAKLVALSAVVAPAAVMRVIPGVDALAVAAVRPVGVGAALSAPAAVVLVSRRVAADVAAQRQPLLTDADPILANFAGRARDTADAALAGIDTAITRAALLLRRAVAALGIVGAALRVRADADFSASPEVAALTCRATALASAAFLIGLAAARHHSRGSIGLDPFGDAELPRIVAIALAANQLAEVNLLLIAGIFWFCCAGAATARRRR